MKYLFTMHIFTFKVFNVEAFINESRWLSTLAVFLIYGFAHIPQTYLLSYIFKVSSTGFAVLTALNITTSIFIYLYILYY